MFLVGVVGLAVSSLLCAVAPALGLLVAARILQGVAGAVLTTSSYALLAHTFENGPQRSKAFATLNFSGSIGLSGGPVVGGLLIETVGWRSIFLLNVCVAIVLFLALRFIDEHKDTKMLALDGPGQLLSIFMLTGLAIALIQGRSDGWFGFAGVCALATVAFFAAFIATEHRSANPMLPLVLFRRRAFSAGTAIIGLWRGSLYGLMFFLALYFQNVNGYSSLRSGLAFLPVTAGPLITNAAECPTKQSVWAAHCCCHGNGSLGIGRRRPIFRKCSPELFNNRGWAVSHGCRSRRRHSCRWQHCAF